MIYSRGFLRLLLATVLVLAATLPASAVELKTAPFPGSILTSGVVRCSVLNVGSKAGTIDAELHGNFTVLSTAGPVSLGPNIAASTSSASLASSSPTHCRCNVPSKNNLRCSFEYINGTVVEVIPAQ